MSAAVPEVRLELVSVPTETAPLDGLHYEPAGREIAGSALLLHGITMNFYSGVPRFLPPHLTGLGIACLAFNRRGHDVLSTRDGRRLEGGAYQTAAEAIEDIRLAAGFLRARGLPPPFLIGHGLGGTLAARYAADHPETPGLVLLSAHAGGKSTVPVASASGLLAGDRLDELRLQARRLVASGHGERLLLLPGWWHVASASSLIDLLEELPDLLEIAPSVQCPALYLRGDREPRAPYPAEEFARRSAGTCEVVVAEGCDHFYRGVEAMVGRIVSGWITAVLAGMVS